MRPASRTAPLALSAVILALGACDAGGTGDTPPMVTTPTPEILVRGEALFDQTCRVCHGERGTGADQGPPLVHGVYKPSHHADIAFLRAAQLGVRAHHWRFGDMPPIPGVSAEEIGEIVGYIRWLQREVGID